jgi:hypothetical protein
MKTSCGFASTIKSVGGGLKSEGKEVASQNVSVTSSVDYLDA